MKKLPTRFITIAPGVALPEYFIDVIKDCKLTGATKKLLKIGDPLKADYIPPYVEVVCRDIDEVLRKAKQAQLRMYRGKKHITISDGVYQVRIHITPKS